MSTYRFRTEPMLHQRRALRAIIQRGGVCGLLMDPGTGKSKVVIDYLAMLTLAKGSQDWLIAAPLSALDSWPEQFATHLPKEVRLELIWLGDGPLTIEGKAQTLRELTADRDHGGLRVVLINHDAFGSKAKATGPDGKKLTTVTVWDRIVSAVEAWQPDGIVVDESHRLKTHTSRRSKAFARLARATPRRLLLTGTVAPRNLLDLFGQWLFLNPATFGTDWNRFRFRYAKWGGYMDKQPIFWLETEDMRARLLSDAFVAKKEDALDLPPVTEVTLPVRLAARERKAYIEMGQAMLVELPSGEEAIAPIPITKMLRQRQLTGGYVGYEREDGTRAEERLGDSKARVCADKLADLVDAGEKVVVFAHFRADLDIVEERARAALPKGVPIYRVDGATKKADRMAARTGFRDHDGPAVFVAQMRVMSLGVNELVVAAYGIVYSMSERRDDFDQALDRLDRQGQTRPVTIYHLIVPDSVDELLLKGHQDKLDLERIITTRAEAEHYLTLGEALP
jgi:hypothetical protein